MSESAKKRPSWLSSEEAPTKKPSSRALSRKGPLADSDTDEIRTVRNAPTGESGSADAVDDAVPRVSMPGAPSVDNARKDVIGHVRANPGLAALALVALLALASLSYFVFFRGGEERPAAVGSSAGLQAGPRPSARDPFAAGSIHDSGVLFGALREEGGEARLEGAGLDWSGTVVEKEGGAGETVTLEGPTAAQLERGFDLGSSSVETGVYAVAQEGGEVLHVTTHTFLPKEEGAEAQELTLGTVYSLDKGELDGYAYYLDRRQDDGSDTVTRTYVKPGAEGYSVSYEAEPGAFVPLLVGWRGFGDAGDTRGGG